MANSVYLLPNASQHQMAAIFYLKKKDMVVEQIFAGKWDQLSASEFFDIVSGTPCKWFTFRE